VGRVQNFTSWSPEMVPQPGTGCLGLEYFCSEGDPLWEMSDEALVALAKQELVILGFAKAEQMADAVVVRQKKAYPVYDDHYKTIVSGIREELAESYPGLHLVGRNGMHKYNNQDHAMMTAILTAENIIAGEQKFDIWNVNEDAEYHEEISNDRQAALNSLRDVPEHVKN
jgi:protoporphyrinogen oxidase